MSGSTTHEREEIALPSLYFTHEREMIERDGVLLADSEYLNKSALPRSRPHARFALELSAIWTTTERYSFACNNA